MTLFSDADDVYDTFIVFTALTVLIWIRHADNIRRLVSGTEPSFGSI